MLDRRHSMFALAGLSAGLSAGSTALADSAPAGKAPLPSNFRLNGTYLNAAYTHPMPLDTAAAMRDYIDGRIGSHLQPRKAKERFAELINASPDEIALIPSTSFGESFVVGALQLKDRPSRKVVTDILHFDGSLYTYRELQKRGLPLTILPVSADGAIDMNRLENAVDEHTALVAISFVSMINGFEHDLKKVCEIAHKKGAKVYVDAIQGAGALPIDVKACGVDFLATSTFKWLMGDFGCGFLYVRKDLLPSLARPEFGYRQPTRLDFDFRPGDPFSSSSFAADADNSTAKGFFEVGSMGIAAETGVAVSLRNILDFGVENIQKARQPLMDRLADRLSARYQPLTPRGSQSPIIAFGLKDADKILAPRLKEAKVNFQLYDNRFRISPSVYNSLSDVDRAIDLLLA